MAPGFGRLAGIEGRDMAGRFAGIDGRVIPPIDGRAPPPIPPLPPPPPPRPRCAKAESLETKTVRKAKMASAR